MKSGTPRAAALPDVRSPPDGKHRANRNRRAHAAAPGAGLRSLLNETIGALFGLPGFFAPRIPAAPFHWPGTKGALSFYDTAPLRATLDELADFDLFNSGSMRLSVGAVDVRSGNFVYFDSASQRLDARHIMASGANAVSRRARGGRCCGGAFDP